MSHERPGIEPVMVIVLQDEDIVKIAELELLQPKSKLYRGSAYQDRHFGILLYLNIMEVLGVFEYICAEEKFPLFFQAQPVVIFKMTGYDRMIKGLRRNKAFKLMPGVQALKKQGHRAVKEQYSQYQGDNDNDFHKVPFFFVIQKKRSLRSGLTSVLDTVLWLSDQNREENPGRLIKRK